MILFLKELSSNKIKYLYIGKNIYSYGYNNYGIQKYFCIDTSYYFDENKNGVKLWFRTWNSLKRLEKGSNHIFNYYEVKF